jgi:hypothetical protein
VVATQLSVCPQPWLAHDAPTAGSAAHVPHSAVGAIVQNADWHCAENEHGDPLAPGPAGTAQPAGGDTPDRYDAHVSIPVSPPHTFSWFGLFAVLGAFKASVHANFWRVTQVARSGQRRCKSAAEHVWSLSHVSWASAVHA